jgi:glutamate formiminotransferase/formiminotetrahydrofolate cyclodeaminase
LETGIWGAHKNVLINLKDIQDENYKEKILIEANTLLQRAKEMCEQTIESINKRD